MRKLYIISLVTVAALMIGLAWAEQLTLTTYYPAPYGVYNELRVNANLGLGTTTPGCKLDIREPAANAAALKIRDGEETGALTQLVFVPNLSGAGVNPLAQAGDAGIFVGESPTGAPPFGPGNLVLGPQNPSSPYGVGIRLTDDDITTVAPDIVMSAFSDVTLTTPKVIINPSTGIPELDLISFTGGQIKFLRPSGGMSGVTSIASIQSSYAYADGDEISKLSFYVANPAGSLRRVLTLRKQDDPVGRETNATCVDGLLGVNTEEPKAGMVEIYKTDTQNDFDGDRILALHEKRNGNGIFIGTDPQFPNFIRFRPAKYDNAGIEINPSANPNLGIGFTNARDVIGLFISGQNAFIGLGTANPTSKLQVVGLPVCQNNAQAISPPYNLTAGAFYRTNDGTVKVVY